MPRGAHAYSADDFYDDGDDGDDVGLSADAPDGFVAELAGIRAGEAVAARFSKVTCEGRTGCYFAALRAVITQRTLNGWQSTVSRRVTC
jgi:hypothetical protein